MTDRAPELAAGAADASRLSAPHDGAYKTLFSHPLLVEHLLRGFVHEEWVAQLDFVRLEKLNARYVSEELLQRSDDLVWRAPLRRDGRNEGAGPEWLYLYLLLEFQSQNEPWMALRLNAYVSLLYQDLIRSGQVKAGGKLPPVFPLVLYNGESRWRAPQQLGELIDAPAVLKSWQPALRYALLDEGRVEAAQLAGLRDNVVACLVQLEGTPDPQALSDIVARLLGLLAGQASLRRAFTVFIHRVVLRKLAPHESIEAVEDLQEMNSMLAERVVSWTEKWKQEGLEKGLEQGREEGREEGQSLLLQRQLTRRFGPLPAAVLDQLAHAN